ncbi:uncharacterized protein At1g32220, chloroplastic-like [Bidens hawaiensis]|uniref:uncharacterized protein At1g32220, chloroplastic-like n=1 Tax=Bidens hawaiensis TaxID=980011 RepID=UPI004049B389
MGRVSQPKTWFSQCRAPKKNTFGSTGRGRFLSTESNKIDEPLKVEEAETLQTPPPALEKEILHSWDSMKNLELKLLDLLWDGISIYLSVFKFFWNLLLILGGNGFVGSHICKEALDRGLSVASLSRSGKSSIQESWANKVDWRKGDLLSGDSWKEALDGVTSVISCVGGFGSNAHMYKINGTANINAVKAAAEKGIKRFVYISAAGFGVINYLIQGYYDGKRATETELLTKFPYGHVILRPGFIYGTRRVGSMKVPLGVIGSPLEMVMQYAKPLTQVPIVGPVLTPPVDVKAVAKVAVRGAIDPVFPPGIVDVYALKRYSQQK